jgi:glycerol kinase
MSVLAIDQGTTSTRAMILDGQGEARIVHVASHQQHYPAPGWVEHDPEELIAHIHRCIEAAGEIAAIGLDNQGESCLAWNAETKEAVSPVLVWQDNRTQADVEGLKSDGVADYVTETSGLPLESYFSASKLAWIVKSLPEAKRLLDQGKLRLGTTDAFFLDRLSGSFSTDITTASRTSLMNLETGNWDPELCRIFAVPIEALPAIVPTTGDFGAVESGGRRIPITASVVDQQAALYGHGCRRTGDAKITFGTGAFALAVTGEEQHRAPAQGLLPTVAWQFSGDQPVYALDGGVYCAGSAVNWGRTLGLFQAFEEINAFDKPPAIDRNLAFVPALSGLACPHWDRNAVGLWIGMSLDTGPRDMMQAILEGIAFRASEVLGAMGAFASIGERISVDGGMSVNPYFCQFLADLLERQLSVPAFGELTTLGTAMFACQAPGIDISRTQDEATIYQPAGDLSAGRVKFDEAVLRARNW